MSALLTIACFLVAFALLAAINRLDFNPWLRSEGKHWTERARILWPARRTNTILILYLPLILVSVTLTIDKTDRLELILRWVAATAGAMGAGWFMVKRMHPDVRFRPWLHDFSVGLVLKLGIWLVIFGAAYSMPADFNARTWLTLSGVVVLQIAWPFMAIRLLRVTGIIRPPGERLLKIVASCTRDGGPKVRGLWQASGLLANAMAFPLSGTLIFLDKLMDHLDDDEVASVCAHEIGHLAESKVVLVGRYVGAMSILPLLLIRPASAYWEFPGVLAMCALMILWSRLSRKLVNRMEKRADSIASVHHEDGKIYARALEKLYQVNHIPAVMPGELASHPHLFDRMLAAGVTPEFPRPAPPRKFTILGWLMLFGGPVLLVSIFANRI